jgi:hypothetical protein
MLAVIAMYFGCIVHVIAQSLNIVFPETSQRARRRTSLSHEPKKNSGFLDSGELSSRFHRPASRVGPELDEYTMPPTLGNGDGLAATEAWETIRVTSVPSRRSSSENLPFSAESGMSAQNERDRLRIQVGF